MYGLELWAGDFGVEGKESKLIGVEDSGCRAGELRVPGSGFCILESFWEAFNPKP